MRAALHEARLAAKAGETPVGAVLVDGKGEILAIAHNQTEQEHSPLCHAEMLAIAEACKKKADWRLTDCSLYVTLEPCPMCMGAILHARLSRVVYGAKDARAGACGSLLDLASYPFESSPACEGGLLSEEALSLLRDFFQERRKTNQSKNG